MKITSDLTNLTAILIVQMFFCVVRADNNDYDQRRGRFFE
jgi:hypothetical protein